jgi:hypothetical protein
MSHDPAIPPRPIPSARRPAIPTPYVPAGAGPANGRAFALPTEPPAAPAPVAAPSRRRRIAAALITPAILLVATLGGHAAWTWHAERRLARYVETLRGKGEPVTVAEVLGPAIPESDNGAVSLRAAGDAIDVERWGEFFNLSGIGLPLSEHELDVIRPTLAAHRDVMRLVREAMGKPALEWTGLPPIQARSGLPPWWGGRGPGFYRQRSLARLLYASALVAHQDGDDRAAFDRIDELLFLAEAAARRPSHRAQTGSYGYYEIAFAAVAEVLPELSVGDGEGQVPSQRARGLLTRLLDERVPCDAMLRCLRAERARYIDYLMPDMASPVALATDIPWSEPLPMPGPPSGVAKSVARPAYLLRAQDALERLNAGIESFEAVDLADFLATFPLDPSPMPGGTEADLVEHASQDDAVRQLVSAVQHLGRAHYMNLARRRTTATALALALYRAEHGRLPAGGQLSALVPAYLPGVPGDPLSTVGDSLIFLPDAERPRVYSVGEDGIDDGGSPADPYATRAEDMRLTDWVIDLSRQPRIVPPGFRSRG